MFGKKTKQRGLQLWQTDGLLTWQPLISGGRLVGSSVHSYLSREEVLCLLWHLFWNEVQLNSTIGDHKKASLMVANFDHPIALCDRWSCSSCSQMNLSVTNYLHPVALSRRFYHQIVLAPIRVLSLQERLPLIPVILVIPVTDYRANMVSSQRNVTLMIVKRPPILSAVCCRSGDRKGRWVVKLVGLGWVAGGCKVPTG